MFMACIKELWAAHPTAVAEQMLYAVDGLWTHMSWAKGYLASLGPRPRTDMLPILGFQRKVVDFLKVPCPGHQLLWIHSRKSKIGKSSIMMYLVAEGVSVITHRDSLRHLVSGYAGQQVIFYNLARDAVVPDGAYADMETLSDGMLVANTMFHGGQKDFHGAWLVITANHPPDVARLPERIFVMDLNVGEDIVWTPKAATA